MNNFVNELRPVTVMLTASGSQFAPGIIKCLKNNGERKIKVVGGDIDNDPSNQYGVDVFRCIPLVSDMNYTQEIARICEEEGVDILLPQMSAELPLYLEHLDVFAKVGTLVSMTQSDSVTIANNKRKLFDFMSENQIPVPKYYKVSSLEELREGLSKLGYPEKPVVIKVAEGSGSRGVRVIDENQSRFERFIKEKPSSICVSYEEIKEILIDGLKRSGQNFPELILMEYLSGDEYDIDLLAEKGRVLYIAGRRNTQMLMSITQTSVLEYNQRAENIAEELVKKLELDGNIGLDFKFDEEGQVQLLEINPRIDATVSIFAAGGMNLPYLRVKQLLKEELPKVDVQYGVHMKRKYLEIFTDSMGRWIEW